MYNIISKTNDALWNKTFTNGLGRLQQTHCQVTLTDDGYRIYRTPNKTQSTDGNVMWGGLLIRPFDINATALQKNHTYVITFDMKGKSNNAPTDIYWSNNAGWSGANYGLSSEYTTIVKTSIPTNWESIKWIPYQWIFKVTGEIIKTCTKSYSTFVEGNQYNVFRDFKFGFTYANTGEWGTDIYLRNFRLYDITENPNETKLLQTGIFQVGNLVEYSDNMSIKIDGDLYTSNFIEW